MKRGPKSLARSQDRRSFLDLPERFVHFLQLFHEVVETYGTGQQSIALLFEQPISSTLTVPRELCGGRTISIDCLAESLI